VSGGCKISPPLGGINSFAPNTLTGFERLLPGGRERGIGKESKGRENTPPMALRRVFVCGMLSGCVAVTAARGGH